MITHGKSNKDRGSLVRALSNTGITVIYFDLGLRVVWSENVPGLWSEDDVTGQSLGDFMPFEATDKLVLAKEQVIADGAPRMVEISVPHRRGDSWFTVWIDADGAEESGMGGVVMTAVDISDQKRREQTLHTLLREVAHRSKNLLAIIQSIAVQTGRHSESIDTFLTRFRGRLQSLASTQDLITSSNWRGASLHDLVFGQVGRYVADRQCIRLQGEKPYLNPNAALHIGLALHELAVNSVSYGALAHPDGHVTIAAKRVAAPDSPSLALTWEEDINVPDKSLGQKRFGSVALERVVPASLNGSSILELTTERLTYSLLVPDENFEIE
jgi:two-component sensor histidine kinase